MFGGANHSIEPRTRRRLVQVHADVGKVRACLCNGNLSTVIRVAEGARAEGAGRRPRFNRTPNYTFPTRMVSLRTVGRVYGAANEIISGHRAGGSGNRVRRNFPRFCAATRAIRPRGERFRVALCASPAATGLPKDKYLRALHYALRNTFLSPWTLHPSPLSPLFSSLANRTSRIIIAICSSLGKFRLAHREEPTRPCSPFFAGPHSAPSSPFLREYLFPPFEHSPGARFPRGASRFGHVHLRGPFS